MKAKQSLGSRIRGWLPHEPSLSTNKIVSVSETSNKCQTQVDPKVYTRAGIANAVVMALFLIMQSYIDAFNAGLASTILSWSVLMVVLVLVNILIYRHYTKQVTAGGGN